MRHVLCLIGEDLFVNSSIRLFVDELFRIVGLDPDPPNEFYWNSSDREQKPAGFGIVEFTVSVPEREEPSVL